MCKRDFLLVNRLWRCVQVLSFSLFECPPFDLFQPGEDRRPTPFIDVSRRHVLQRFV